ncbi:MAG TPA: biopolymer transporter ExbD [Ignavibacteriaceae bacterium]|jgi:biopolymer transport protein ExbD|nr:biopolymer transporter ExbD [Ignavibacteriaceae bacterium]HPO55377.1 biopolymer transporter ExbD [Ignavibacteriaceae bacterium]
MKFQTENKPLAMFNFSSLTDIVMLLLIFFLLTSQFVVQTGVKVKLPGAKNNDQVAPSKFIVTLTQGGGIYIGEEPSTVEELGAKLGILKSTGKEDNLIIRADKSVPIELVIRVIDAARGAGIEKFTLETEKEKL